MGPSAKGLASTSMTEDVQCMVANKAPNTSKKPPGPELNDPGFGPVVDVAPDLTSEAWVTASKASSMSEISRSRFKACDITLCAQLALGFRLPSPRG